MLKHFQPKKSELKTWHQNHFRVALSFSHGDADGDTEEELTFKTEEEVLDLIQFTNEYFALDWNSGLDWDKIESLPHFEELYREVWPYDMTSGGNFRARYSGIAKIEYFLVSGNGGTWIEIEPIPVEE